MSEKIKSGKEILDDFFENIETIEGVDQGIAIFLKELYSQDNLKKNNIESQLEEMRNTENES